MPTNNYGKKFESNFRNAAKKEDNLWFLRIQDSDLSFCGGNSSFTNESIADCLMFYKRILFICEMKSTQYKSISIETEINSVNKKMIKMHQIKSLSDSNTYDNIEGVFIFNFRDQEQDVIHNERIYIMNIVDFINFMCNTQKKSINEKDILDYGGIQGKCEKKRKWFTYYPKELLELYIQRKELD